MMEENKSISDGEDVEEEVSSYCINLRKMENTLN
jgi:hypothetical protein